MVKRICLDRGGVGNLGMSSLKLLCETTIMWHVRGGEGSLGNTNEGKDHFGEHLVTRVLRLWLCPRLLEGKGRLYLWHSRCYWDTEDHSGKPKMLNPSFFQIPLKLLDQRQLLKGNIKFEKNAMLIPDSGTRYVNVPSLRTSQNQSNIFEIFVDEYKD